MSLFKDEYELHDWLSNNLKLELDHSNDTRFGVSIALKIRYVALNDEYQEISRVYIEIPDPRDYQR